MSSLFIKGRNFNVGGGTTMPPLPSFDDTLTSMELLASNIFYAGRAKNLSNTDAIIGERINRIYDRKGNYNLDYIGWTTTSTHILPLSGGEPILHRDSKNIPFLRYYNIPHSEFSTLPFSQSGLGWVTAFVIENHEWGDAERFISGSAGDIGTINGNMRFGGSLVIPDTYLTPYKRTLVEVEITTDNKCKIYFDGQFKGQANIPNGMDASKRQYCTLGVTTNNADWNFYALYDFRGADYANWLANHSAFVNDVTSKFTCGQFQSEPYPINLTSNYNSTIETWTATFLAGNATNEQKANAKIFWYIMGTGFTTGGGSFDNQKYVTGQHTTKLTKTQLRAFEPNLDFNRITPYVQFEEGLLFKGETKMI